MQRWRMRSQTTVLDQGKYLKVENHVVELPDGEVIAEWPWVITPAFINVVVITEANTFLCFRQTKYAVEGTSLAPVGGYLEPGEAPLETARRELLEETGYEATEWTALGAYAVDGNRGSGIAHLFLAQGARRVAAPVADDLEEQELLELRRDEVAAALVAGEFKVLPWATVVALALLRTSEA